MKITLKENPLFSTVELTDHEKEILMLKVEINDLDEHLGMAHLYLEKDGQFFDIEKARREVKIAGLDDQDASKRQVRLQEQTDHLIAALTDRHVGDCTCVPCSCAKCYAEQLVNADTLGSDASKYTLNYVNIAFNGDGVTICEQAIQHLKDNPPKSTADWMTPHIERWTVSHSDAIRYLERHAEKLKAQ